MIRKAKKLLVKYREQAAYLIVGAATTAINYIIYVLFLKVLHVHYIPSNIVAWVSAVTFAYFANGRWVYRSTSEGLLEAGAFFASRLFSLGLETLILYLMVDLGRLNELISKIFVTVLVAIVNYLTGLLVFRKKGPRRSRPPKG